MKKYKCPICQKIISEIDPGIAVIKTKSGKGGYTVHDECWAKEAEDLVRTSELIEIPQEQPKTDYEKIKEFLINEGFFIHESEKKSFIYLYVSQEEATNHFNCFCFDIEDKKIFSVSFVDVKNKILKQALDLVDSGK